MNQANQKTKSQGGELAHRTDFSFFLFLQAVETTGLEPATLYTSSKCSPS